MKLIKLVTIVILLFAHASFIAHGATSTDPNTTDGTDATTTQPNSDDELIAGAQQSTYDWMTASFDTIASFLATCIEVPQFANILESNSTVNLEQSGQWVSTGVNVVAGNMLGINWKPKGVVPRPVKYKVLYRIDPRFEKPQVFIQKYDYVTQRYISDFDHFKDGILPRYQDTPEMTFTDRIIDIPGYFNFSGRASIPVRKDDVVNISIIDSNKYFGNSSEMNNELGSQDNVVIIYSQSGIDDNKLIYTNATQFCADAITPARPEYAHNCAQSELYWDVGDNWKTMQGRILNPAFNLSRNNLSSCSDTANGKDNIPLCYYDKGRGIQLTIGGTTVKAVDEKFMTSSFTGKDFFYYKSNINGNLEFQTSWLIDGMYNGYSQFMKDWSETDYTIFQNNLNIAKPSMTMNFLHFGRYFMEIEIGSSVSALTHDDMQAIKLEYIVKADSIPSNSDVGTSVEQIYKGNAPESGLLFVRAVSNDDSLVGTLDVNITTYAGSGWFSDLIYAKLIDPLRQNFNILTMTLYQKFITNIVLHNIARLMLVVYIMLYALMFLAGVTEITVSDIVVRIVKISIVVALFTENSWSFFNGYLFNIFTLGIDNFMTQVSGVTSSVGNVFGFIDPIIDRYSNPKLYALLLIQLIQFPLGFTFFAIIVFYSMWIYFKAIMEVIISYCLAFVGLAVLISLAPFFITFILFERTKGMFDNWISLLFSYMIQPTILLVFFLLIDQIVSEQLMQTVMRACWGILIPLSFTIDLNAVGIPINFSFTLPFLPGIPFYIPDIFVSETINDLFAPNGTIMSVASSTFILFSVSKLAGGLVEYVSSIVQLLTQVSMGGRLSSDGKDVNPVKNIMSDMGKLARPGFNAAKNVAMSPSKFAKEKIIDQKITHRNKVGGNSKINYGQFSAGTGTLKGMNIAAADSSRSANQGAETGWKAATPKGMNKTAADSSRSANQGAETGWKAATPKGMNKTAADSSRSANQGAENGWKAATPKGMNKTAADSSRSANQGAETGWKAATPKGMNKTTADSSRSANQGAETGWKAATPKGMNKDNINNNRTDTVKNKIENDKLKQSDPSKTDNVEGKEQNAANQKGSEKGKTTATDLFKVAKEGNNIGWKAATPKGMNKDNINNNRTDTVKNKIENDKLKQNDPSKTADVEGKEQNAANQKAVGKTASDLFESAKKGSEIPANEVGSKDSKNLNKKNIEATKKDIAEINEQIKEIKTAKGERNTGSEDVRTNTIKNKIENDKLKQNDPSKTADVEGKEQNAVDQKGLEKGKTTATDLFESAKKNSEIPANEVGSKDSKNLNKKNIEVTKEDVVGINKQIEEAKIARGEKNTGSEDVRTNTIDNKVKHDDLPKIDKAKQDTQDSAKQNVSSEDNVRTNNVKNKIENDKLKQNDPSKTDNIEENRQNNSINKQDLSDQSGKFDNNPRTNTIKNKLENDKLRQNYQSESRNIEDNQQNAAADKLDSSDQNSKVSEDTRTNSIKNEIDNNKVQQGDLFKTDDIRGNEKNVAINTQEFVKDNKQNVTPSTQELPNKENKVDDKTLATHTQNKSDKNLSKVQPTQELKDGKLQNIKVTEESKTKELKGKVIRKGIKDLEERDD